MSVSKNTVSQVTSTTCYYHKPHTESVDGLRQVALVFHIPLSTVAISLNTMYIYPSVHECQVYMYVDQAACFY